MTKDIKTFMTDKVLAHVSKRDIHEQLSAVGWSDDEIDAAYAQALVETGVPVPHEGTKGLYAKKSNAIEVIINLFSFILLGVVVTALITLYFSVINYFFPDALDTMREWQVERARDAIHYAMAALIIGFPLYFFSVRMWFTAFRESEGKVESKLTKWITYLILLVASVTVVGDLIAVLNTFLQGEISARFLLKGLTVLVVAGAVFSFYFMERKKIQYRKDVPRKTFQAFGWSLLGVIVVGIILGFIAAGTPGTERERRLDSDRADDLRDIAQCVSKYAQEFQMLPNSLNDLNRTTSLSRCSAVRDPETEEPYEYSVVEELKPTNGLWRGSFELCATFLLPAQGDGLGHKWGTHDAGRACDREDIRFTVEQVNIRTTDTPTPKAPPIPVAQ